MSGPREWDVRCGIGKQWMACGGDVMPYGDMTSG